MFLITQHAIRVDKSITTATQIGIIISKRGFAGFIGALVFCDIVEHSVPEFVDLDVIQLELVKVLVGVLLEMIGPLVVTLIGRVLEVGTPVVRVVGSVLEVITAIVRVVGRALEVGTAVVWVVGWVLEVGISVVWVVG